MKFTDLKLMACLLCKRQFSDREGLTRHMQFSDLHKVQDSRFFVWVKKFYNFYRSSFKTTWFALRYKISLNNRVQLSSLDRPTKKDFLFQLLLYS